MALPPEKTTMPDVDAGGRDAGAERRVSAIVDADFDKMLFDEL